jgi:hypothetical protein
MTGDVFAALAALGAAAGRGGRGCVDANDATLRSGAEPAHATATMAPQMHNARACAVTYCLRKIKMWLFAGMATVRS